MAEFHSGWKFEGGSRRFQDALKERQRGLRTLSYVLGGQGYQDFPSVEHVKRFAFRLDQNRAHYKNLVNLPLYSHTEFVDISGST